MPSTRIAGSTRDGARTVALLMLGALIAGMLLAAGADEARAQTDQAGAWPQWLQDTDHSRQADATGLDDPGLAWSLDVTALGYDDLRPFPSLSAEGDVLVRVRLDADPDVFHRRERLLALDRDTGAVRWEVDDLKAGCGQATDSQGRVWVQRVVGDEEDELVLAAIDPATGGVLAQTPPGVFACGSTPGPLQIGGDPDHLVVLSPRGNGYGAVPGLAVYDVSGASAHEQWRYTGDVGEFAALMHAPADTPRRPFQVLLTEDSVLVAVEAEVPGGETRPELVELDLASGAERGRLSVPVDLAEAEHDEPRALDVRAIAYLRADDDLVLGVEASRLSDARGLLAGVDLATGLDEVAWQVPTGVDGAFTRGPRGLTASDGAVVVRDADPGFEPLRAFAPDDGRRLWTGTAQERSYPATGNGGRVADVDGGLYVHGPGEDVGAERGILAGLDAAGRGQWYVTDAALEAEMGLEAEDLWRTLVVSALDDDLLVVTEDPSASAHDEGRVIALDDSGGLAEPWPQPERISGADRIETSVELSRTFDAADTVLLATARAYPDSLAGAPLASLLGAPILLTEPEGLAAPVIGELDRLEPERVILLGGEAALGSGVEDGLRARGFTDADIERFAGQNRYATAAQIAARVQELGGDDSHAYVVEGDNPDPGRGWPDAVAVSALAADQTRPILLVTHDEVPLATAQAAEFFGEFTVVGGEGAVSESVADWFRGLEEIAEREIPVHRLGGMDRYETSAMVADEARDAGVDPSLVYLATGRDWPDSMSAAPVAGATAADLSVPGGVLLLVDGDELSRSQASADWLEANAGDIESVTAIGGQAALNDEVLREAQRLVE